MRKKLFALMAVILLCGLVYAGSAGRNYHEVQVIDETGAPVTDISSVTVTTTGTGTSATIYQDRGGSTAITQPITTSSTNTTLSQGTGTFYWWGPPGWDYIISAGTNTLTSIGQVAHNQSDGSIVFPTYLRSRTRDVEIIAGDYAPVAAESGMVFVTTASAGSQTFTLPTAVAGLTYTFVDISTTGNDDLIIQAASGDTINGGTAAKKYWCSADSVPGSVTLVAVDGTAWVVVNVAGTWANDNN